MAPHASRRISRVAARLLAASPAIAAAHFRVESDPYDPIRNPNGYINLGTAENRLVGDLLAPRLADCSHVTPADTQYAPLHGARALREAVAAFLSRGRRPVAPEDLIIVSGATGALDVIASTLCDPGETIIVPAPYYAAFDVDLAGRSGARLIHARPTDRGGGRFALAPAEVEQALARARAEGITVRAVALTSPHNPVGCVHPPEVLRDLLQVAADHQVDVISDEIYAHSVFGPGEYVPLAEVKDSPLPVERIHTVWGFAKDFGLAGFKVGVLHTVDPEVRAAARELAYFAPVSTHTQAVLTRLLSDDRWVTEFLAESARRLGGSYRAATAILDDYAIPYTPAQAGFSIFTDLGRLMPERSFAAESFLWAALLETLHVSVLPGGLFGCPEPGWFRICHTTAPELVGEALNRIGRHVATVATGSTAVAGRRSS
jgi:1-aminocyclopropane-1-carboxylate synthase